MSLQKPVKVLVAGANGQLAQRVLHYLSQNPQVEAVGLVRNLSKAPSIAKVSFVEADIAKNDDRLQKSLQGVKSVISAVQGGPEVIIQGQETLLNAAIKNNVTKFIPSDFSVNIFKLEENEHPFLEWRRQFANILQKSGIPQYQHVLNGCFYDVTFGFWGVYNKDQQTVSYYGSEDQAMDFTSVEDTAKYIAQVAVDFDVPNGPFHIVGQERTIKQLAQDFDQVRGTNLKLVNKGSIQDLKELIAKLQKEHGMQNLYAWIPYKYQLPMFDGRGKLKAQNARYPQIVPQTWKDFLQTSDEAKKW